MEFSDATRERAQAAGITKLFVVGEAEDFGGVARGTFDGRELFLGGGVSAGDDDDFERTQGVTDALELGLHVARRRDIAIGQVAEVELHAGLEAPFQRHLVYAP